MDVSRGETSRAIPCCAGMRTRTVLLVALALAVALAMPGRARAEWDDRPEPGEYEEELAPNGYWVDEPQFGHVWRPYVDWGWRPYVDGHWSYSPYGWTWVSAEPWGWTFHYGRWGWSNLYGWVWTPGNVWGPAWVDWYWGDGFVGWVPLGPAGFVVVPGYWTYVHDYHFCAPRVTNVVVVQDHLPPYVFRHREHGWGRARPPDIRDIDLVSRHRVERVSDRPRDSIAPWVTRRIERGERVRERIADRGEEHIVEHPGRGRDGHGMDDRGQAKGDTGRGGFDRGRVTDGARDDRNHPVVDDGGWRRRDDGGRRMGGRTFDEQPSDRVDRGVDRQDDEPRRPSDVDRRRSYGNDVVVVVPQRPQAPRPQAPQERGWNRPPSTFDAPQAPRGYDRAAPTPPPRGPQPQIIEGHRRSAPQGRVIQGPSGSMPQGQVGQGGWGFGGGPPPPAPAGDGAHGSAPGSWSSGGTNGTVRPMP
jgi:hypothetical protein